MSSIVRPRRTGLVVFAARILSVFTGLLFLVMMTRWLSPSQFGLWEVITTIVAFSAYPVGVVTYWATRDVARGSQVAKSTLVINQIASLIGVAIYLAFALLSYEVIGSNLVPFMLAVVLVPLAYWTQATGALLAGLDPAVSGYSLLLSEPAKLIVAYPLLYMFRFGIYGILIAISFSYLVQGLFTTYKLWPYAKDKLDLSLGKKWLSLWHVPSLGTLNYLLSSADTFVATMGQGATTLAGYYQAAYQVSTVIAYGQYLSVALYPALLRRQSERLVSEILEFSMLFAIPMAAGVVSLAPQILYLLRPEYASVSAALVILSASTLVLLFSNIIDQTLTGRETADLEQSNRAGRIIRSDLMFVPVVNLVFTAAYVAAIFVIGHLAGSGIFPLSQLVSYWALVQLVMAILLVSAKFGRLRKRISLAFPKPVLAYATAAVLMGVAVHFTGLAILTSSLGGLQYGVRLAALVFLGAAIYFGVLVSFDRRVRGYFRSALRYFTGAGSSAAPTTA